MKIPFLQYFAHPLFNGILEHAEKVKECTWAFQQAVECYVSKTCDTFDEHRQEVAKLNSEAEIIEERIRSSFYKRSPSPLGRLHLMMYTKEQANIGEAVVASLNWLSYRHDIGIPEALKKEVFLLVDAVIEPIEELNNMLAQAKIQSKKVFRKKTVHLKNGIAAICQKHSEARKAGDILKSRIFSLSLEPDVSYHMVRFAEIISAAAGHAENAGEILGIMVAK
jgi:predicted phosphate transport protein (TIGR00153 family)